MLKNPTPKQLALFSSLVITSILLLILLLFLFLKPNIFSYSSLLVLMILMFFVTYITIRFVLKYFIYRRIKLIYKHIHEVKLGKNHKPNVVDMEDHIIDQVDKEVQEWASQKQMEITKLKTTAEYRRNFVGNVAHELKTPIFAIQGYILTLLEGGLYDEKVNVNYLQRASNNVDRLNTIIEDLDAIYKLESGQRRMNKSLFNIRELADEVFQDLEIMARDKSQKLVFKEGADKGFPVKADREHIRQVLTNLVSNAINYGKVGGTTKISFYDMDDNILIEISDNGQGIPKEVLPRVFERFFRVETSRSRVLGGSGLGLAIVKHIIEAHEQTVNVRSQPGLGSTFNFTLEKVN